MTNKNKPTDQRRRLTTWKSILLIALTAMMLGLMPGAVHAQSRSDDTATMPDLSILRERQAELDRGIFPRLRQRFMRLRAAPLLLHGTVTAVEEGALTIELEPLRETGQFASERRARLLERSLEFTFALDETTLLFDNTLSSASSTNVAVGDAVTFVPELAWGQPTVTFLFEGTPQELITFVSMGRLLEENESSLLLQSRGAETTVLIDETTLWVEGGQVEQRPTELRTNLPLRILGIEEADGSVRAVMVTPLR